MSKQTRDAIAGAVGLLAFVMAFFCCIAFAAGAFGFGMAVFLLQWQPAVLGLLMMAFAFAGLVAAVRAVHWVWDR